MKQIMSQVPFCLSRSVFAVLLAALLFTISCRKIDAHKKLKDFEQVNLVDNNGQYGAAHSEPKLQNAWGLSWSPTGIAWVDAEVGHVSALFSGEGVAPRGAVDIPSPMDTIGGAPTGTVFNGTGDFVLSNGNPARFLFVGTDGVLSGWNGGNRALRIKDNSSTSVYTGLAIGANNGMNYLYAADFKAAKIVVWDKGFNEVMMDFKDPAIPTGYAPFNIQAIGSWLYVMYAKVGNDGDEEKGVGNGFVSIFNMDGSFVQRFASNGLLNAPWGLAKAPAGFFEDMDNDNAGNDHPVIKTDHFSDTAWILVGNFGDGRINAYDLHGNFLGQMKSHGHPIVIDGLWALSFPPSTSTIDQNRLYFTAGPDDEKNGLFGYLIKK